MRAFIELRESDIPKYGQVMPLSLLKLSSGNIVDAFLFNGH